MCKKRLDCAVPTAQICSSSHAPQQQQTCGMAEEMAQALASEEKLSAKSVPVEDGNNSQVS